MKKTKIVSRLIMFGLFAGSFYLGAHAHAGGIQKAPNVGLNSPPVAPLKNTAVNPASPKVIQKNASPKTSPLRTKRKTRNSWAPSWGN